jgi:2-polyprenyl-3-methyl-5-hydroxy-6-metoxy-1,4-benzoquinol methylase
MLKYHLNEELDVSSRNIKFIDKSVGWIINAFDIDQNKSIADFGCGPGLYTNRLAKNGAKVTGIDFSKNSIEYARNVAGKMDLDVKYEKANYLKYETAEKFDLIIMIMCDFCALSAEQRRIMLSKFQNLLKEDGSLLLDVYSLHAFNKFEEKSTCELNQLNGFWSPNDYYAFVNSFKYEEEKVSLDKYTIFEENKKRTVYNWLQYYDLESLVNEIKNNDFNKYEVYSDVAGTKFNPLSDQFAIAAKK